MQCPGALKRPLRKIIQSIGTGSHYRPTTRHERKLVPSTDQAEDNVPSCGNPRPLEPNRHSLHPGPPHLTLGGAWRSQLRQRPHDAQKSEPRSPHLTSVRGIEAPRTYTTASPRAQKVAEDASESLSPAESSQWKPVVRSVLSMTRHERDAQDENVFEQVVRQAEHRGRDSKDNRASAAMKDHREFQPRYFYAYHTTLENRLKKRARAYQIQKERHLYPSSDNWRMTLKRLEDNTPSGKELYQKVVETVRLPDGVVAIFKSDANTCILEIMQRTNCHVQVVGARSLGRVASLLIHDKPAFASLTLLGAESEIAEAVKILPEYVQTLTEDVNAGESLNDTVSASKNLSDFLQHREVKQAYGANASFVPVDQGYWLEQESLSETDIEKLEIALDQVVGPSEAAEIVTPIRAVWAEDRLRKRDAMERLFQRPTNKSATALTAYVADLTESIPKLVKRKAYKTRTPVPGSSRGHVDLVIQELLSLMSDASIKRSITSEAVTRATQYFTKHNQFVAFRRLYKYLEDGGYIFTVSNYNVLLAAAAKYGDVYNFNYTLGVMIKNGWQPTPSVWASFHALMCQRFPLEAGVVVEALRSKGLLRDHQTARQVAQNSVGHEFSAHLTLRGDLETFYKLYDNRFEVSHSLPQFNWLTKDVANRMINVLLEKGLPAEAFKVIAELNRRCGTRDNVDVVTLTTFLASSLRDEDTSSAIYYLKRFRIGQPGAVVPNNVTYAVLFALAWRRRNYNMTRVIWCFACAAGHVSSSMQFRVWRSMIDFMPRDPIAGTQISRHRLWRAWAGKFAVGLHRGLGHSQQLELSERGDTVEPVHHTPLESPTDSTIVLENMDPMDRSRVSQQYRNDFDRQIMEHASQLRTSGSEQDFRYLSLKAMINADMDNVGTLKPSMPLADLLEEAWQMDMEWKRQGLGLPKSEQSRQDAFAEMMQKGIVVPIEAGDYSRARMRREVSNYLPFD